MTKIGFTADGCIEVRGAPTTMPDYQIQHGIVALTSEQASTAIAIFGWRRFGESNGLIEVIRTEKEWRKWKEAHADANL